MTCDDNMVEGVHNLGDGRRFTMHAIYNWQAAAHSSHCTYLQSKKAMDNFVGHFIISGSICTSTPAPTKIIVSLLY